MSLGSPGREVRSKIKISWKLTAAYHLALLLRLTRLKQSPQQVRSQKYDMYHCYCYEEPAAKIELNCGELCKLIPVQLLRPVTGCVSITVV